jgi:hypothetical protein
MPVNLNHKTFRPVTNAENGNVGTGTVFYYFQDGDIIHADYAGGDVVTGHLLGKMLPSGKLQFAYHHVNAAGQVMAGQCHSTPEILPDGRLRFHEEWQWLTGDQSTGTSVIEEVVAVDQDYSGIDLEKP